MSHREIKNKPKRHYPPLYEKIIPIALTLIASAIIVVLIIIFSVVLGVFPGS
ncbi:MAG: hypothetical protein ABFQ89_02460 [Chloroflexota bacterium]